MKQLTIILLGLIGVAYGQSAPTSAKTRFVNGLYVGTKLDSYFAAADSNAIYWRADSVVMAKYKGTARALAFDVTGGYKPISDTFFTNGYTTRARTKQLSDSLAAVKLNISDTAAMLAPFVQYSDTTGLLSQVVRTFGTQTIGGNKTFTNDIFANTARIGIGAGGNSSNAVLGYNVFTANTTGTKNTAMGENSLSSNVSATDNTAFGWYSLDAATGSGNTGIGSGALGTNTSGSNNTALGFGAGEYVTGTNPNTTGTNSIYIGFNTKAAANGETNQTVIGHNATGNGSNTVTIGNSSITNNYFSGNIRGGAFIKSGGTSSQFLKADGSVDGTSYATAASLSGYLPLSGGTLTGALSGTSLSMSGGVNAAKGDFGQAFTTTNVLQAFAASATDANLFQVGMVGVSNGFTLKREASTFKMDWAGQASFGGAISGTSLSMSGGINQGGGTLNFNQNLYSAGVNPSYLQVTNGSTGTASANGLLVGLDGSGNAFINQQSNFPLYFRTNNTTHATIATDGTFLINTTTTDGTNKLIVNGGVKFGTGGTATITTAGAATFSSSVTASSLIKSGGTSSQFLKADGSVDGNIYLTTGTAASTYLPLTGGTLTGSLNGTSLSMSGGATIGTSSGNLGIGIAASAWGSSFRAITLLGSGNIASTTGGATSMQITNGSYFDGTNWVNTYTGVGSARYEQSDASGGYHAWFTAPSGSIGGTTSFTERLRVNATAVTSTVPINGTSLSMSGGGSFGSTVGVYGSAPDIPQIRMFLSGTDGIFGVTRNSGTAPNLIFQTEGTERARLASDGTFLINTTTTDGTNKLIVNGGVKFGTGGTTTITTAGAATFSSSVTATQFNLFANNKVSNQTTSQTITSYTVPSDGLYLCSGSIVFTANSGSGTLLQVEWTQAETNTSGTCSLTPTYTTVLAGNGTPVSIYAKAGTTIFIKSLILGGTATYSASGTIQLIKAY